VWNLQNEDAEAITNQLCSPLEVGYSATITDACIVRNLKDHHDPEDPG
jgi:hypothetical protein